MMSRRRALCAFAVLAVIASGCRPSSTASEMPPASSVPEPSSTPLPAGTASTGDAGPQHGAAAAGARPDGLLGKFVDVLEGASRSASLPGDIVPDGDCPILYPPPDDEIAAQAQAIVPLKAGLTLSHVWTNISSTEDVECLTHVAAVDPQKLQISNGCIDGSQRSYYRHTCRTDLRRARAYMTMHGAAVPETIAGTTSFSLSRDAFLELKRAGSTRHRYLELTARNRDTEVGANLEGTLQLDGTGTARVIVNDAPAELPVLRVSGSLRGVFMGKSIDASVSASVLDDERFPLVLDYRQPHENERTFAIRYTKISYPTERAIETRLAEDKRVDVYGIYFDFASDRIRPESDVVLQEISAVLTRNRDWTLDIAGHTDNVGSDVANLDLSQRRSAAVRTALVERFAIAGDRLSTTGHGEAAPKDTNETPEGRARNRRVELVRR